MPTILLVEDNPTDEHLALRALKKSGIINQIDVVRDGQEALDYLFATGEFSDRVQQPLPSVVLLDLKLPKLNGFEVLKAVRENPATKHLRVIMVTSSCEERDVKEAMALESNDYMQKPIESKTFTSAYEELGRFCLSLNENCNDEQCGRPAYFTLGNAKTTILDSEL